MVNNIQYGGQQVQKDKDGKETRIPVPSKYVLQHKGPIIRVTITQPQKIQEIFKAQNRAINSLTVNALIDTGASSCIITDNIAQQLGLIQTGFQKIYSVQDNQNRPKYFAQLVFPWGSAKEVSLASCPLTGIDCLIGRDVMVHWNLIYNGVTGQITICD